MEKTLLERISDNWKVVKRFEGKKVLGKRGTLVTFDRIRKELEKTLDADLYIEGNNVVLADRKCPYRLKPKITLYKISEGKLVLASETVRGVKNIQNWLLLNRKEYEKLLEAFKQFEEQFLKVSYDYLVREENTKWLSSRLQRLTHLLSRNSF